MENSNLIDDQMNQELQLTEENKNDLKATAKWARFLAIVGFVMMGLVLVSIFAMSSFMALMLQETTGGIVGTGAILVFYLVILAIFIFPLLYLYRFANQAILAIDTGNQTSLTSSLSNLKSMFKFWGIYTIVILGFYALALVGSLLFAGFASLG